MLKASIVQTPEAILEVILAAEDLYGEIDLMEDYEFTAEQAAEYINEQCWLIAFHEKELKAFVILEWVKEREANIHFCYLFNGPFRTGWKLFLELVEPHLDLINAYIDSDKQSVIRIAERLGFKFENKDMRYYHGKRRRISPKG